MRAATVLQAAVIVIVAGLLLALAGAAPRSSEPAPVRWRPATEQEQQQRADDRLYEELLRQQEAGR